MSAGYLLLAATSVMGAEGSTFCGEQGVWVQILGSGGPELDDGNSGSSYLVWLDDRARLLVDTAPGSSFRFDASGAKFADLDAIVFTHLHADHAADFPAFIQGSVFAGRDRPLPVIGPEGDDETHPDTKKFVKRLIGPEGAFPHLADFLTYKSSGGYKVDARNVPATGRRRWSRFGSQNIRLSSTPVHHGGTPAVAWRVEVADQVIVFTGDFSNQKDVISKFAKGADALVVSHAIPEMARGTLKENHVTPSQIGQIAAQAGARMLILGHRMKRTRGRETQTREAIEKNYPDPLVFANDLECWGL
ncbi:MAG: MBL fold metallo-hydrolase [Gammaproteobacteria bacterium]|nr:MBL fold metallo-hydrolase [Gammaproteobacteria bacterium]